MAGKKEKPLHSLTAGAIAGGAEACVTNFVLRFTVYSTTFLTAL